MNATKPKKYALRAMPRKWAKDNNLEHIYDDGNDVLAFKMRGSWYGLDFFHSFTHSVEPYVTKFAHSETVWSAVIIDDICPNGDYVIAHYEWQ